MPDAVKLTAKDLLRDGLGENPLFYCLIAEVHNHQKLSGKVTVGFAMYYFTYDPWIGKLLYLEDFYVIQAYQGQVTLYTLKIKMVRVFMAQW